MDMPIPNPRIAVLAARLVHYSIAIDAISQVQEAYMFPPGDTVPDDVLRVKTHYEILKDEYNTIRNEFEKLRADYEHKFMTWHTDIVAVADGRVIGNVPAAPHGKPWSGKVPEWADDESRLAAASESALEAALS
jgi:hypothetical protein